MKFFNKNIKKFTVIIIPIVVLLLIYFLLFNKNEDIYKEIRFRQVDSDSLLIIDLKKEYNVPNISDVYLGDVYLRKFSRSTADDVSKIYLSSHAGKTYAILLYMFEKMHGETDTVRAGAKYYLSYLFPQYSRYKLEDEKVWE